MSGGNEQRATAATRIRRAVALTLAVLVGGLAAAVVPTESASAAVVQWGTSGGTQPNYQATVNGDFLTVGNGVLACSGTTLTAGSGTCADLHSASNANANNVNDNFAMVNNNSVAGFTTNSSTATMTVPAGATVVKAFLNWSANTGTYSGDARSLCASYSATRGTATLPSGSVTGYQTRAVQFQVGTGSIASFAPATMLEDTSAQTTSRYYTGAADVTGAFSGVTTGSAINISAGNIWAPTGAGCYAGWALTVVYDFGTYILGNNNSVPHRVIYYAGHVRLGQADAPLSVDFTGFTAVAAGTRASFSLYEGDRNIAGDTASYSRGGSATFTEIPNNAGATGNIGIGRADGSVRYTQTQDTSAFTNQSVDVDTEPLSNVVAGDSTVTLQIGTSGDSYLLTSAVLSVPTAGIQVTKTFNGTADVQYRTSTEKATFTITLTNTGAGTLQNIQVADDQADCTRALTGVTLLPLASTTITCTATNVTTASYTSTAQATATTVIGGYLASGSDSTQVVLSALSLTKTSALAPGATGKAGDVLTYTFTAKNTGGGPLTGVAITDPLVGLSALTYAWPGVAGTLTAGQSVVATATYTLKQTDVDAGSVANTASTTGTDADGGVKPTATASLVTPITSAPALAITKTGTLASGATGKVGDTINYAFSATNTGNVTLTAVTISDPHAGLSALTYTWPGTANRLNPGQTVTATATYLITQADVDAGSVKNTATITGTPPTGAAVTGTSAQVSVPTVAASPSIATTKAGAYTTGSGAVGSVITYSFSAKNTGNVTLTGVTIADAHTGLSALTYTWPGTAGTLAPGQTVTATATYTVKQSDVDAGTITNTATGSGTPPTGAAVTSTTPVVTIAPAAAVPAVTLTKSGVAAGQTVGSVVTYTFQLTNSGNVTLTNAGIADPLSGLSAITFGTWPSGTTGTLAPGQTVTATATYTLKQSDVDAGAVTNSATATAKPPTGANVTQVKSATVPITPTGALTTTKTGTYTSGTGAVGSVIRWDITFKNTGNVTLTQLALADSLSGLSTPVITWPGTAGTLAPGATATATAGYTVTQADVDAGSVKNIATATGKTPQGATVTGASPQASVTTATAAPGLSLVKSGAIAGGAAGNAGDVISYTFTLKNTGNVTLTGVTASDPLSGLGTLSYSWPTATAGTLAPGQTATATASYTIKQGDVDTGNVKNTASASGTTPTGGTTTATSGQITTATAAAAPAIVTTKSGALANGATGIAGDVVTWTVTLRNSGNVTLTTVAAADSQPGISGLSYTWPGTAGTLAPGQTATATATYPLTQTDVDAGAVSNVATGSGKSPANATVTSTASATVPVTSRGSLSLTKTPSVTSGAKAGDVVTYTFVARNTGNVTLTGVTVSDPLSGLGTIGYGAWPSGTTGKLAPNTQVTATATYTVKQSDVDAGFVKNTASVTGNPPTGVAATASSGQVTVTTVAAAPAITTTKSAAYTTGSGAVGSVLTYTFTAKNTGNVTLTSVSIADPHSGLSALTYTWPATAGTLAPNATVTATATYTVTQADLDTGTITNRATATGTAPGGTVVTNQTAIVSTPTAASAPAITLTKSGSAAGSTAGSTVTYTFVLRNTGNVTLTGAGITDPLSGLSAITIASWPSGTAGTLRVGDQVTGTATYQLTQSDIDAGSVANTSTATATPPTGAAVTKTASATVPITPTGALTTTKSGAYTSGTGAVGSVIRWSITFKNSGNVTLTGVALTDTLSGLSTPVITWPGTAGTLVPGATATATTTYTVTQADVDAGAVKNTATATGNTPKGVAVTGASPLASVATATAAPALSLVKSGVVAGGAAGNAGDVITYTFTLKNIGNVTLTGVAAADPLAGLSALSYSWPGTAGTLAPNQTATATASYTIKQSDVDTGNVRNTATASGTTPTLGTTSATSGQITTNTATPAPATATTKSGVLASGSTGAAGDTVNWSFTVKNTGNVTLTTVGITDSLPGISALTYTWPGTAGTLAPGQTVTATATYTLTQTDVDAGAVSNIATGSGKSPGNVTASSTGSSTVTVTPRSSLSLTKTPSVTSGAKAGDIVTYTFVARNTGNVTLTGVTITDPLNGLGTITPGTWPSGTAGRLLPSQQVTATATYTVKQTDVDAGFVKNTASVTGNPPTGAAATASSGQVTVTTVAASPAITTTKSGAYTTGSGAVGSVITYSFSAKNTGNVTLTSVGITDPHAGLSALTYTWPGTVGTLAPGQTVTATATYTVTQADVDAGTITNQATGTGTAPGGTVVTGASATVATSTAPAAPAISLTKSGSAAGATAGSTVTYTFVLKNTGNVTLTGATITDPLANLSAITIASWPSGTVGKLRVGDQVTGTATYALKQSDVDAGSVSNTATGTASPPTGAAVTIQASATVPIAPTGALTLTKSGAYTSGSGAVGSAIRWNISIANTGNVTLTLVTLSDTLSGLGTPTITWPGTAGTLAPGATATATANYTVTQADVDAGSVKNTASSTARTPAGVTVNGTSPQASVATTGAVPGLSLVKTAVIAGGAAGNAGDVITYTFTLKNTGNVTLTGVTASDPLSGLSALTYSWPGTVGTLAPNQTATATASYTIKQSDVDTGNVRNTATASGTTPTGGTVPAGSGQVTTNTAASAPATATTKSGALATGATGAAGDTVNWSFTVKNTGNVTLTAVGITDSLPGISALSFTWPGTAGTLAPGQTATATATYLLKQTDVDAGAVSNVATGSGTSPTNVAASSTGSGTVTVTPRSSLSLTKTPNVTSGAKAGDIVTYTFVARNTGNTTLTGVTITDPLSGLSAITPATTATLAPGAQVTAAATYTVKQTDVDAGFVKNTASVTGTPPSGTAPVASSGQVTVTTVAAAPSITTTKSGAYTTGSGAVGSVITYSFSAKNTGNVTLTGVTIADPLTNLSALAYGTWPSGTTGKLLPGQTVTATATYTVVQSDVDRGAVNNTATSAGTPPTGANVTSPASASTSTATAAPALSLTKSGSAAGTTAGSTVSYTFVLKNTGNVTLTGAGIGDPLPGLTAITIPTASWPSGTVGTLRVGDQVTGTATYALKQSDVDAGAVSNTATATATPPSGAAVSRTASSTVPIASAGAMTLGKSSAYTTGSGAVGSVITYTFTATNSGNVTLTGVAIADPLVGLGTIGYGAWPSGTTGTLRVGDQVVGTATYTVTQTDVNRGNVINTASVSGRNPTGGAVTASSPTVTRTTAPAAPAITTAKSASVSGTKSVGDTITYTITATNSGNVTLTGVTVSDPMFTQAQLSYGTWTSGTTGTLQPGQSISATGTHTITQADVDAGSVVNTASSSGTPPTGAAVTSSSPTVTTPLVTRAPTIALTQSGALPSGSTGKAGDIVTWTFTITDSGNTTLTAVGVVPGLSGISAVSYGAWPGGTAFVLAPGQSVTATATSTLTQAQVDAGSVTDPATASGTGAGSTVTASKPATVTFTPSSSISLTKSGAITSGSGLVGSVITYTFVAKNTGATTLTNTAITDPHANLSAIGYGAYPSGTAGTLRTGDSVTATATYTLTQADVDAGNVKNTASVAAKNPQNANVTGTSDQVTVPTGVGTPALSLTKTAAPGSGAVGSVTTYTFVATNTGQVSLTGVAISDPLVGTVSYGAWPTPATPGLLTPGQSVTATATYTLTQTDVDRGYVDNRATVAGTPPVGAPISAQSALVHTLTAAPAPKLDFTKTGSVTSGGGTTGSVIGFSFSITNSGNVTLTSVAIADQLQNIGTITFGTWPGGVAGTLAPGTTVTATANYTATQSDVDSGSVVNTATASGTPSAGGAATSTPASATVPLSTSSGITLTKSSSVAGGGALGSTVTYTFVATNTGAVTLKNVTITDPLNGLGSMSYGTWTSGTTGTLLPNGQVTATATYTVTQADVDRGSIMNTATVNAKLPNGTAITPVASNTNTATTITRTSTLSVTKSASITTGAKVGDVIRYTVTATNTGNTTLTGVTVTDPLGGLTGFTVSFPAATGVLAPGAAATATGNYQVTQADVDGGSVVNTAAASGTPPTGPTTTGSGSVTTNTQTRAPSISVTDSGALAAGSTGRAGDIVTFSYLVTNTGNTTLTAVGVTETLSTTAAPTFGGSATVTLAPGKSATATASHVLTQAEVDAHGVTSNVSTSGTPPTGAAVTATGTATVPVTAAPDYTVLKSAAFLNGGTGAVGDTVRYTLTVPNTGNVTLYRAQLVDPLPGLGPQHPTWPVPAQPGVIAPGQTATGYADYVITQADVDLGHVDNTAHVAFFTTPTAGGTEIDCDSNAVRVNTVQAAPRLTTTKSGVSSGTAKVGDTISWTVVVANSGNVTVTGITIAEQLTLTTPSTVWQGGATGTLAPGATATLTGTTTILQSDVDAGAVANTASASGVSSRDAAAVTSNTASATVRTQASAASVHQTKSAAPASGFTGKAGDLVTFSYSLTNTGNVSLTGVSMAESLSTTGALVYTWPGASGTLAVGATVTATAQHRLTQAEVDAGGISSPVTGVGTPPAGAAQVSDTATAGITVTSSPAMAVTKSGVTGGTGAVGNHITYSFTITNTGNVTLSLVDLIDSLAGVSAPSVTWPDASKPGVVAPGQVATATSDYVITQADVDSGSVKNTATASGKPPIGDTIFVSSPLTTTTVAPESPALTVTKTATPSSGLHVGDTIRYAITATNTGNVTVAGITVADGLSGISALTPTWSGTAGSLAPGQNVVYAATYQATQSDIDAGSVVNSATVSGTTVKGTAVSGTGSVTTNAAAPARSISISDAGALAPGATGVAGDTVIWSYVITNTGTVTLTGVTAAEALASATAPVFGTWPGTVGTLAPGQSVTASSSYVLTQADVDAHVVSSAASTRGATPAPGSTTVTAAATASVPITARPDYSVLKSAALLNGGIGAVGDTVRYTLTVPNTGNVTLYRAQLVDPLPGLGPEHPTWPDAAKPGVIAPGQTATGYADYVLTQADIDLGHVDNTAHVAFFTTPVTGGTEIDRDSNAVRVTTSQAAPQLTVAKSGVASGAAGVGSTISWTVVVTNSGNVTVTGVTIAEQLTLTTPSTVWQGGITGTLAPGRTATLTGTTTIQQSDVDAGAVANTASASGLSSRDGAAVGSNTASATVRTQNSAASVHQTKTAAPASGFTGKAGDLVTFSYSLTNTGNVSLTGVSMAESLSTTGPLVYTWTGTPGTLAVGATVTATAQHRLTQAEVDAGGISSPVTGVGTPPAGAAQVSDTATAGIPVTSAPAMAVTKHGVTGGTGAVGNHITYSFTITNTGNVTLSLVDLADTLPGVSTPSVTWPDASKPGVVAPGQVATATSDYVITQADVDSGNVKNTATASGKPPIGDTIFVSSPPTTTTVQAQAPALTVVKTANPTAGLHVGDTIQYSVTATNTGNVTLGSVIVSDGLVGIAALTPTWSAAAGTLAPGENVVYATSYIVTQSDIDAGSVVNSATVSGRTAQGTAVSGTGTVSSTAAVTTPQLSIVDSGALAPGATGVAGDTVIWSYVITNTGGVTLTGVTAAEALTNATAPTFGTWPGTVGTLAPGQSVTASSSYVLTQADVDAHAVSSAASTRGTTPAPGSTTVTANATATVPLTARPDYTVVKSAAILAGGTGALGDTVRYTLTVTNTGNVTLYRAQLVDPLPGLGPEHPSWPDPSRPGVVAPGQTATGYADYVITQADVDLGHVDNTAHVAFFTTPTTGGTEIDRDSNAVRVNTVQAAPRLTTTKSGVSSGTAKVGDTISWTVTVANAGNVTVTAISITDDLALQGTTITWGGGIAGTLAPGAVATLTGTTVVTQTDVDAGSVANTAHSSGRSARDSAAVVGNDAPATVRTIGTTPAIGVTKSATRGTGWTNAAGDIVDFAYTVTNTGNTTLTGVALAEALTTVDGLHYTWPDPANPGRLLPGQTATATARYAITQADVDRGSESSAVTAVGTPASGAAQVSATASAGVTIDPIPSMAVTKNGVVATTGGVGDTIGYSFTIVNTGNVTLTLVDLLDSLAGVSAPSITWPRPAQPGVLLPGEQATATASYTITQADVDRGTVANVATASGKPPVGDKITQTSNTSTTTVAAQNPRLTVTKTANPTTNARLGTVVDYAIAVTNSGNVTLTGITVTDALPGLTGFTVVWPGTAGTLAPGQVARATPSYRVAQTDVDAGHIDNTAAASGISAQGTAVSDQATATTQVVTPATPAISVTDAGALNAGATGVAGDTVTWTYVLANTGDVTLHGVTASESQANATAPAYTWPGAVGVLAPGQSVTATTSYVLTQADVNRGSVVSNVTAGGFSPSNVAVTGPATATVTITARPSFTVLKGGSIQNGGQGVVGDTIRYTLSGVNTGNVTLYRGNLIDPLPGLGDQHITWPTGTPGVHPPGTTVSGYADYVLTQADIDRGFIDNVATIAEYTTPSGNATDNRVVVASNLVHIVTVQSVPQLTVVKSSTTSGSGTVGDTVTYTVVTSNTGDVTITGIAVTDPLLGAGGLTTTWPGASGTLAPGTQATSTGVHVLTQADIDRGSVVNTATASGSSARDNAPVTGTSNQLTTPTATRAPAVTVSDTGALATPADAKAGGTVVWHYRITNTGNVTLTGVAASDTLLGIGAPVYSWPGAAGTLAPGAFVDATASYTLTQADVDAGSVVSIVSTHGTPPTGADATASDTATVLVQAAPTFTVTKTGALLTAGRNGVGDTVVFSFVLSNTGNVTLRGVTLTDSLVGLGTPTITWPTATAGVLPPGTSASATARYQFSQADVDAGSVSNRASATATPPSGPVITAQSTVATVAAAAAAPALRVVKGGALSSGSGNAGSVVRFTFTITNSGNVTISGITLSDALAGLGTPVLTFPGGATTLAPGAVATGYADATITQADVDLGHVDNSATASGTAPGNAAVSATSNTFRFTTAPGRPSILTGQTGALASGQTGQTGDTIHYVFTATNTGNVTLTGVTLASTVGGLITPVYIWPGTPGVLAPGQTVTLQADHLVTQAEVDAAVVRNVESSTGTPPSGAAVGNAADELVIPLATSTGLSLTKVGALTAPATGAVGDVVGYSFDLTNTGTQTLTAATISDGLAGVGTIRYATWPRGTSGVLEPGDVEHATASYTLTQADVDRGRVTNTATGSALDPSNARVSTSSPASVVTLAAAAPAIVIAKTAALAGSGTPHVGDLVTYTFDVSNPGNVTLNVVGLGDDQPGLSAPAVTWPGTPGILAPGQHATATASYALTQADIDTGSISSTASTQGTGARGGSVADSTTVAVTIPAVPSITLDKTASPQGTPALGTTVLYVFTVTNTGNVTLNDVSIADSLLTSGTIAYGWPGANGQLLPGQSVQATASYTVTQPDVDAGAVANTATVTGTPPTGAAVSAQDSAVVAVPNGAAILLTVTVELAPGEAGYAGDHLIYHYTLSNTGNRAVSDASIVAGQAGLGPIVYGTWPGAVGVLLPGQSVTATATYLIAPSDEGTVVRQNPTATATGATASQIVTSQAAADIQLPTRAIVDPGGLARTGSDPSLPATLALLLVLWGLVLFGAGRRRRKENA